MKKYLLVAVLAVFGFQAFTQISKGQWLAGGIGSFSYNRVNGVFINSSYFETTIWQLSPGVGYIIIDKLATGIRINFRSQNNHSDQGIKNDKQVSLAPFVRYYFLPKANKVNLFADASYIYGRTSYQFKDDPGSGTVIRTITDKMSGYAIAAGPAIFLNRKTALELTVSFTKNGDLPYYNYGSTINIMGGIGFQVHLGK